MLAHLKKSVASLITGVWLKKSDTDLVTSCIHLEAVLAPCTIPEKNPMISLLCLDTTLATSPTAPDIPLMASCPSFDTLHLLNASATLLIAGSICLPILIARSWNVIFRRSSCILVVCMFFWANR